MKIELINVNKTYQQTVAVNKVSLTVNDGEMMVLLGPSGCGKSTLLRVIAGLIEVSSGKIMFDGADVTSLPSQKRNTSMVFQNYALFPHLNTFENIAFGLKMRRCTKDEIAHRVDEMMHLVELEGLGKRRIQELSGGQRQRVALARALITRPDILLFDEPLSNLDEKLRIQMRQSIKKLQREFGITSIYVTHDQEEAMSIADRITVMNNGDILQTDTPGAIYNSPKNHFVAEFVGQANFFEIRNGTADILGTEMFFESDYDTKYAMLRPERVYFADEGVGGVVTLKESLGLITRYIVQVADKEIKVDVLTSLLKNDYAVGIKVYLKFDVGSLVIIERNGCC